MWGAAERIYTVKGDENTGNKNETERMTRTNLLPVCYSLLQELNYLLIAGNYVLR